ncbi:sensor histidine kinase [Mammaliicoccus sciuri]|uniref:sensor histidine kinase n=1 Tax=Mammaliicoccus sciuri TaxID=1296 RepID=UPI00194F90AF|nr:sensor histidine kinase [Mammaliicoccus sciuri]MCJ0970949.1 sensor histidine kinase [Mammaliicoccus sciuri]
MIKSFLKERWIWILLFLVMQAIILLTSWLDVAFSFKSALYLIGINLIIFIVFIWLVFTRETRFYRALKSDIPIKEIEHKELNQSTYEKIVFDYIQLYDERTRRTIHNQNKEIQATKNDLLDWIHEVKTPITAMKLLLDQIEEQALKKNLLYEWSRIDYLLDQQLYIRRLSSKGNDFYFGHYDIKEMVIKEIQHARNISMAKGIGYDIQIEDEKVYTDEKWCCTVIRQLISNALKYTENKDIIISTYEQHDQTYLKIQDFGRGIKVRDLPRIFERGFTSTTNRRESTATGMGLYLVKEITEGLSIKVNVKSTYGEGTTVLLIFPQPNDLTTIEQASDNNVTSNLKMYDESKEES